MESALVQQITTVANGIRKRVAEHTITSNGGYLCQACSSAEILASLYLGVMKLGNVAGNVQLTPGPFQRSHSRATGAEFNGPRGPDFDRFILSPSQYSLVLYAALVEVGRMSVEGLKQFNQDGSVVEMIGAQHSPAMEVMSGSLGQGISQAAGIAHARKMRGDSGRVVVFMSDGEFQSGQTWECVQAMAAHKLDNVIVFVDVNGQQCDGPTKDVCNIEPLDGRLSAFNAQVIRVSGHDIPALLKAGERGLAAGGNKPVFVLCDTCSWKGLPFLEQRRPKFHYVRFKDAEERKQFQLNCQAALTQLGMPLDLPPPTESSTSSAAAASSPVAMVSRPYGKTLIQWAKDRPYAMALSADLTSSVELDTFRAAYPTRFFSMGIAEQNMVSWAGGMAREGLLPMIHTFAVFIYRRAFDQVAMSVAYPNVPVLLMGFLPGVTTPGGATHQATEDLAVMRALPNMTVLECGDATDCESVLDVAEAVKGPVYVRILRGDVPRLFPQSEPMAFNKARLLVAPTDHHHAELLVLSSGICTEQALRLFKAIQAKSPAPNNKMSLMHISTLKPFTDQSVMEAIQHAKLGVITMENHSVIGGLGSAVSECIAQNGWAVKQVKLGLQDTFAHGASRTYLMKEYHLDSAALLTAIESLTGQSLGVSEADLGAVRVDLVHSVSKAEAL